MLGWLVDQHGLPTNKERANHVLEQVVVSLWEEPNSLDSELKLEPKPKPVSKHGRLERNLPLRPSNERACQAEKRSCLIGCFGDFSQARTLVSIEVCFYTSSCRSKTSNGYNNNNNTSWLDKQSKSERAKCCFYQEAAWQDCSRTVFPAPFLEFVSL